MRLILLTVFAAAAAAVSLPAPAAGPPPGVPLVPDTAQERAQAQLMIQQAQAQARLAASQAKVQAQLDANQARLEGQLAAQRAGAQAQLDAAQLDAARQAALTARLTELPPPMAGLMQAPSRAAVGTMELTALTPQLGRYFGTDRGVLVVRAPKQGVLKLQDGDVILSIGGRTPASGSQAIRILTSYDPGETIRLVILREHHRMDITATLPALPPLPQPPPPPAGP